MENIFNQILKNFTLFIGGKYAGYYGIGITLSIIMVFIVQLIYCIVKNKKTTYSYLKFSCFTTVTTLLVSICEFYTSKKIFTSIYYTIIYTLFNLGLSLFFNIILSTLNYIIDKKTTESKQFQVANSTSCNSQKLQVNDTTKKALLRLKTQPLALYNLETCSNDFIDVEYIKELISSLKDKPLTLQESEELEELEVFLLNFCYRRPNQEEKDKLSSYLSSLMKKLAYYKIVE